VDTVTATNVTGAPYITMPAPITTSAAFTTLMQDMARVRAMQPTWVPEEPLDPDDMDEPVEFDFDDEEQEF
jgi:hypothetical protein